MLERYNVETCMFFPLVGEMDISPWEMQKAFELSVGEFSYEKHVPPFAQLQLLRQKTPEMYSTTLRFYVISIFAGGLTMGGPGVSLIWLGQVIFFRALKRARLEFDAYFCLQVSRS